MMNFSLCFYLSLLLVVEQLAANPLSKKNHSSKTKSGGAGGFYGSRYGSIYNAKDFESEPDPPPTAAPAAILQFPSGVAGPHQQNMDEIHAEIPNVEENTARLSSLVSEELRRGVKEGVKGGIKGGVKGSVKGGAKGYISVQPTFYPSVGYPTTALPDTIRVSISPNSHPVVNTKRKTKAKGIKGGSKGYQYEVGKIKELFSDDLVTVAPPQVTTIETYTPQIVHVPNAYVTTTENYQYQQTELPIQQTELPVQQTELPVQQTEHPVQQTELPVQQTELPVQQTELPVQQTELPVQQTELPVQQTELPIQTTERPTEYPTTRDTEPTTVHPTTTYEPIQETQSPEDPQVTQVPDLPIQTTITPTTTEEYTDQQTEIPQLTQEPEEPIRTTVAPDEFSGHILGIEGSHLLKGAQGGKTKGKGRVKKGTKGVKKAKAVVQPRTTSVVLNRSNDPSVPLLPSLMG